MLVIAVLALLCGFTATARAAGSVSPGVNSQNGFPLWYEDAAGNRVEQCLDPADAACIVLASDFFNPVLPMVFPVSDTSCATPVDPAKCNFPDEFFYTIADSDRVPLPGCGALSAPGFGSLRIALEGAFASASGAPAPGQQIVFARTRVVVRGGLCPSTRYTFRTPFGDIPLTTDATGGVKPRDGTSDIGCLAAPCNFSLPTSGPLFGSAAAGGFLHSQPAPGAGLLGDAATPGPITAGTNGNTFAIVDGAGHVVASTNAFTVAGKIAGPLAASPSSVDFGGQADGTASAPRTIALTNLGDYPTNGPVTLSSATIVAGTDAVTSHPAEFTVGAVPAGCTALARDATCQVQVQFTPAAAAQGRRTARLRLDSTGFRTPQFIDLTGNATNAAAVAQAIVSPASLDFGSVRIRETGAVKLLTVSNPAGPNAAPLLISDVVITGADSSQFTIASNNCQTGTTVDPGQTCTIGVRFAPFGTAAGAKAAQLTVTTNAQVPAPAIPLAGTATGGRAAVSPTLSAFDGYPDWYMAEDGATVAQCIDPLDPYCIVLPDDGYNGVPPLRFLDDPANINFPTEFFYQVATSDNVPLPGCNGSADGLAFVRTAIEGAFTGALPAAGDQMVFGRVRVVVRGGLCPNSTYKFTHPYGQEVLTTDDAGAIKPAAGTDDVGCLAAGAGTICDFSLALSSRVLGGLVRWDPAVPPAAPAGYLGDAVTLHAITGAPYAPNGVPANSFRIEHVGINPDTNLPEDIVDGETDQFTVMGKLLGPLVADNPALGFGTVAIDGATRTQTVTLTNSGVDPLTISTVTIGGLDAAEFTTTAGCVGLTLAPGQSCPVDVTFDPAAIGVRAAVLQVTHTGLNSPFEVGLSGIGSVGAATPNLSFAPRSLAFAPVHINRNSSIATVTVTNAGASAPTLTIADVRIAGDPAGVFTIVDNRCQPQSAPGVGTGEPGSVPGGGSCQIDVLFTSAAAGDFTGKLEVVSPDFPPIGVNPDPTTLVGLTGSASAAVPAVSATVDGSNGFPRWYQDGNGVRIEPCLSTTNCVLLADAHFNPANPVAFPTNFPGEFFYAVADSDFVSVTQDCGGGVTATGLVGLRLALEGTFVNATATPTAGDQAVFGRMRILPPRGAGGGALCPDTPYTFVTPYGVIGPITTGPANGAVAGRFKVNDATLDIGCGAAPCNFADALGSPVAASFVRWDPNVAPAAPAGYLGDAVSLHAITGGTFIPAGQSQPFNGFQVLSGSTVVGETTRFAVAGHVAGPLQADQAALAFGHQAVNAGPTASRSVTVRNVATTPITLGPAPQVTGANFADFQIAAGAATTCTAGLVLASDASCTVAVAFDPGTTGAKTANLTLAATTGPAVAIALSGTGDPAATPVVALAPASVNFGNVTVRSTSAIQTVTVQNTGTGPLNISAVTRSGANAADFTLTTATASPCMGVPVNPGANCTIQVQLTPSALGLRSATLTLTHNPAGASLATSSTVPLSGTGTGSILSFTTNPVKFGTVNRNTFKDQTITVKNTGNAAAPLTLASFAATGTGYTVRSTTCANLAVNNTCNVVVRFTAPNVVGTFNGSLSVTAANGVPATVSASLTASTK